MLGAYCERIMEAAPHGCTDRRNWCLELVPIYMRLRSSIQAEAARTVALTVATGARCTGSVPSANGTSLPPPLLGATTRTSASSVTSVTLPSANSTTVRNTAEARSPSSCCTAPIERVSDEPSRGLALSPSTGSTCEVGAGSPVEVEVERSSTVTAGPRPSRVGVASRAMTLHHKHLQSPHI